MLYFCYFFKISVPFLRDLSGLNKEYDPEISKQSNNFEMFTVFDDKFLRKGTK